MDSTFSTLGFLIFGISISFYAFVVQSQIQDGNNGAESSSPAFMVSPPPPPLLSPPPPTLGSPPSPGSPPPRLSSNMRRPPHHHGHHGHHRRPPPPPPPPPPPHGMNAGKKVGLLFVGIAVIMQFGMVGFLVIKRRQLLKANDRYENCS
ncbi:uncharacterized protein LOC133307527 [Gastrolobium bilobum]|uniref:uncharacterized protein LOC133307527 n=1 Tax=Gastrolobium bilobum TaxID=150636 RepID=UPI002AAFD144|nr:uncharacterized protein LOC133307527 [Gastrolobium bilobum]